MRSGILISLIVVVLCAGATATERPASFYRGDIIIASEVDPNGEPNGVVPSAAEDPNRIWDPAAHLAVDWESISVSMTSQLYNPATKPNTQATGPQWSLSVTAFVDIVDSNGLIGWTTTPTSVQALDQDGKVIVDSATGSSLTRWYQQPRSFDPLPGSFPADMSRNRFSLRLPVDPNAAYPDVLSRVEWSMGVLLAEQVKTVDVPFKASDTWVELTPGMEIMVEQATVEQGKYQYRIKTRYDRTKVDNLISGSVHLWRDEQPPAAAVLKLDVLNAQGKRIRDLVSGSYSFSGSSGAGGSNNQMTGTASGSGSCDVCGTAATIRYTLAFGIYEQEVHPAVENVPVPVF